MLPPSHASPCLLKWPSEQNPNNHLRNDDGCSHVAREARRNRSQEPHVRLEITAGERAHIDQMLITGRRSRAKSLILLARPTGLEPVLPP